MSQPFSIIILSLPLICAASCADNRERNIIVDRGPFVEERFTYDPQDAGKIVSAARQFAVANKMDFLLARESLPEGAFNATAAGHDLNLRVMHVEPLDRGVVTIFAIVRDKPNKSDFQIARKFACAVGGRCSEKPTLNGS
jgi:hypothetical protein